MFGERLSEKLRPELRSHGIRTRAHRGTRASIVPLSQKYFTGEDTGQGRFFGIYWVALLLPLPHRYGSIQHPPAVP